MRTFPRNPLDNLVRHTADLVRDSASPDRRSGANGPPESAAPPTIFTTIGAAGATVYPFLWDLDAFDNPNAVFGL